MYSEVGYTSKEIKVFRLETGYWQNPKKWTQQVKPPKNCIGKELKTYAKCYKFITKQQIMIDYNVHL